VTRIIALAAQPEQRLEAVRSLIVLGCAMALILAGNTPF
jgi:hypothetical protein